MISSDQEILHTVVNSAVFIEISLYFLQACRFRFIVGGDTLNGVVVRAHKTLSIKHLKHNISCILVYSGLDIVFPPLLCPE